MLRGSIAHSIQKLLITLLTLTILAVTTHGQKDPEPRNAPVLSRASQRVVAPGTSIELRLFHSEGIPENSAAVVFIFIQNQKTLEARPAGGTGEQDTGFQTFNVTVPEGLAPGVCHVVAQLDQLKSEPVKLIIGGSVPPPIVSSEYAQVTSVPQHPPRPAQTGDIASVDGRNFSPSDEVEITDSQGVVYRISVGSTSSAGSTCFSVPQNIADGEATFEIVEQRSGLGQRSKKVRMPILNVPLPLEILPDGLRAVAPGQWLEIGVETVPPYDQPNRVEVEFEQETQKHIVEFLLEPNDDLHVQVPETLLPGDAFVKTRTLRDGRVSEWSQPRRLQLLEQPVAPFVDSVQRMKSKGNQSEPLLHLEDDRVPLLGAPVLMVGRGERIAIRGSFGVESTKSVRINLVKGAKTVSLKPAEIDRLYAGYFEVELPDDLQGGEWQMYISEEVHNTSNRLKVALRVR